MKRRLTLKEIESILNQIEPLKCIQVDISKQIHEKTYKQLKKELEMIEIYPAVIPELTQTITKHYYKSQIQAGECVGVLTAQSLGERQTQMCLDAFHSTGISISTVVSGVPRFIELLNATKNPKGVVTTIHFKKDYNSIPDVRKDVGTSIVSIRFEDIVKEHLICEEKKEWHTLFDMVYGIQYYNQSYISYKLNNKVLFKYSVALREVKRVLEDTIDDICCAYSFDEFDVFVQTDTTDVEEFLTEIVDMTLRKTHLFGIEGITDMMFQKNQRGKWFVQAVGYNLPLLGKNELVDFYNTCSNNMWEIYTTLGLEATREFLVREFFEVVSVDSYINKQHIELLVDTMLYGGNISPVSRYGVERNQSGPLTKSSFEKSLDHFLQAGVYGDLETTNGVSSSIMCGKPSISGTGLCTLLYKV